ncbi:PIN domain-containing protein [Zobellella maritima]|uniref:PIN domain-containing protein n=1 Tax=Zobellella maritima TaxID=2059725 RepID=UPI000E30562F|nr:PIN domain-containing protein [Zobellella maritima]
MQVLISDANVLIDVEAGQLLTQMFQLPFKFKVSDMLYHDELSQQHSHLLGLGLIQAELMPQGMIDAFRMVQTYSGPSRYDCFSLALAKQESCPLLTGDGDLRKAASQEGVVVMGTIWIVEQLVIHEMIDKVAARTAYSDMKASGSRLPWSTALARLEAL